MFNYVKMGLIDPNFVVAASAAGAGANIFFQAVLGIQSIVTTHSLLMFTGMSTLAAATGIGACVAVAGLAVFCVVAGNIEKWRGLSKFYSKAFHKELDPSHVPQEERTDFLSRFLTRPRVKKFLSRPSVEKTKKLLLVGITTETNSFTVFAAGSVIVRQIAGAIAAPHTIPQRLPLFLFAVKWGAKPVWNLISAARVLGGDILRPTPKARKEFKVRKQPPVAPPPGTPSPAANPEPSLKSRFDKEAANQNDTAPAETEIAKPAARPMSTKLNN
jgi:hypothetical protein